MLISIYEEVRSRGWGIPESLIVSITPGIIGILPLIASIILLVETWTEIDYGIIPLFLVMTLGLCLGFAIVGFFVGLILGGIVLLLRKFWRFLLWRFLL